MEGTTVFNNEQQQQFQVKAVGETAFLEYRFYEGNLILMHTEVPDILAGKGVGSSLASYALNYARTHHLPVKVYCPFILEYLKKHPGEMDIVVNKQ
jgi:uncharacterized protein